MPRLLSNPPRKQKTRDQVEKAKEKAARFARTVLDDPEKAEEFEHMSDEDYAEKKRWTMVNPSRRREIIENALRHLPSGISAEERLQAQKLSRDAVLVCGPEANELEIMRAANDAMVGPAIRCARRLRKEKWLRWLSNRLVLPLAATEDDEAEAKEIVCEVLDELPVELSDYEVESRIRKN
jgi:hypothetical protein